ncbi:MAG: hypothetical protein M3Y69_08420, partial [Verrucomicrobiota bacterium]|nr:hypothetical protein [Verrucomicrobiota bacterium]
TDQHSDAYANTRADGDTAPNRDARTGQHSYADSDSADPDASTHRDTHAGPYSDANSRTGQL